MRGAGDLLQDLSAPLEGRRVKPCGGRPGIVVPDPWGGIGGRGRGRGRVGGRSRGSGWWGGGEGVEGGEGAIGVGHAGAAAVGDDSGGGEGAKGANCSSPSHLLSVPNNTQVVQLLIRRERTGPEQEFPALWP
ncbi:hypothetical protein MLD38_008906 [Melastoma candidum]|uniref:Uncharacterized protein n=1 Tax=Melastoma candidum TaxID=119954 RepID=A0ACB9RVH8_9MYRT|nr:hypothetical protein MLD38_008906 [Melastoma candidum]